MAASPTQRSLKAWRDRGYMAAVVEKWNPHARIRQDLFGCVDLLVVGHGETIAVQTTSYSNVSARVKKIREMPEVIAELHKAGWRVIVEGWHKPQNRWVCREVEIQQEDMQ